MKKIIFSLLLFSGLIFSIYLNTLHADLSDKIIRLHIVANSNSEYDQRIKLMVRDAIIEEVSCDFKEIKDKDIYKKKITQNLDRIKEISDNVLSQTPYNSEVSFEKLYIPRKKYKDIILPEGTYDGIIIRIGKARGENWWCVVYPPLCFTESTTGSISEEGKKYLSDSLSPSAYSMISESGIKITYKFKLVEFIQKIKKLQ